MTIDSWFGDWMKVIDNNELNKVLSMIDPLYNSKQITPDKKDVFNAFLKCPYEEVKVVILGQDPYPQKGVATGLAFGNKKDVDEEEISPSLEILKRSAIAIPWIDVKFDNTLERWAEQGVLLLNTSLTCEVGKSGSHYLYWYNFIKRVIINLSANKHLIWVLLGNQAGSFQKYIQQGHIFADKHPSYYARLNEEHYYNFFEKIDELLEIKGEKINWYD